MELFSMEVWALAMFVVLMIALFFGYPVAFTLGATALLFGGIFLDLSFFNLLPLRIWGVMTNFTLLAVPLFVFMGVILEKSGLAEDLLETMGLLFGTLRGGLALSIVVVGGLLAATTGVVGATVVTMGIIALPSLLKNGYSPALATGTIATSGTLGQIIPPSIVLILLGDVIGVPVGSLFLAAVVPGTLLIFLYILYIIWKAWRDPDSAPALASDTHAWNMNFVMRVLKSLLPALLLIIAVLGSIFFGIATPTESAAFGAMGALLLAFMKHSSRRTNLVFLILIEATIFGVVFHSLGNNHFVYNNFTQLTEYQWYFIFISLSFIFIALLFLFFIKLKNRFSALLLTLTTLGSIFFSPATGVLVVLSLVLFMLNRFMALLLTLTVLGAMFFNPAIGILGILLLVLHNRLTLQNLRDAMRHTTRLTSMVFLILIGATAFGLVFRGLGGDNLVHDIFTQLPGGKWGFIFISLLLIFLLGFFLDFLEICFIVVPILAPIAVHFQIDLLWFAILIAVNLQTSFLTPPFGFSLFYLKAVAPPTLRIGVIYQGIVPFVILQVLGLILLVIFPQITLWLPNLVDN